MRRQPMTDSDYLIVNLFAGDETRVKMETKSIVAVRKPRVCLSCRKKIHPGERARIDRWFNDEDHHWEQVAHCLPCVEEEF